MKTICFGKKYMSINIENYKFMNTINRIALIGAGNVATHLGKALKQAGYSIIQVFSRTQESASELAEILQCSYVTSLAEISTQADLYLVSVKDAVLEEILPAIGSKNPEALFVHTAGSVPMGIWEGKASRYGVLYPMQTFSKQQALSFQNLPFFIEANRQEDVPLLQKLAESTGAKAYEASSEQRKYLHLAAVFACNFSNQMYAISNKILQQHGLPFEAMFPLIDETARKVHQVSPVEAQTGPAKRNDRNVMDRHLNMLAEEPELAAMYEQISHSIHQFSSDKNK